MQFKMGKWEIYAKEKRCSINMETEFIVRTYKTGDFKQIQILWEETGMGNKQRGDDEVIIAKTIASGGELFILENTITSEIIGTSWLTNDQRRIYLHHFGIKPTYQDKGLSKPLLEKSLEWAKNTKLQIKLEVHIDNSKAILLYEKYGFKRLGDYDVYIIRRYD